MYKHLLCLVAAAALIALAVIHASSRSSSLLQAKKRKHALHRQAPVWLKGETFESSTAFGRHSLVAMGSRGPSPPAARAAFWEGAGDELDRAAHGKPKQLEHGLKAVRTQMLFEQPALPFYEASNMGSGGDWEKYGQQLLSGGNGGNPYAEGWAAMKPGKSMGQLYQEIDSQLQPLAAAYPHIRAIRH